MPTRYACLGWGSLTWMPGALPASLWVADGPYLPLEFARLSKDGRVTLVVTPEAEKLRVLWSELRVDSLDDAINRLADREGCPPDRIGRWPAWGGKAFEGEDEVAAWAKPRGLDGVVWTALPANWDKVDGRVPTIDQVRDHLLSLEPQAQRRAMEYIRNAPAQIHTAYRDELRQLIDLRGPELGFDIDR